MERILNNKQKQKPPYVRPIRLGGTDATTPQLAMANLGGIHLSALGMNDGVAPLNASAKIPAIHFPPMEAADKPSIFGQPKLYVGESLTTKYVITNFDTETTYTVSANVGIVSRVKNVITYTPPQFATVVVLTVNNVNFAITIVAPYADTPVIVYPTANQANVPLGPTLNSNIAVYGIAVPEFTGIEWELATDSLFTDIIASITKTNGNKTWQPPKLDISTEYYIRVRYTIQQLNITTPWSNVVHFTTTAINAPISEMQILSDIYANGNYSRENTCIFSNDGTLFLASDSNGYTIHIYHKVNNLWELAYDIVNNDYYSGFGMSLAISDDNSIIAVGTYVYNTILIHKQSIPGDLTSYQEVYTLYQNSEDPYFGPSYLGMNLHISKDTNQLFSAFAYYAVDDNATDINYEVRIYDLNSPTYAQDTPIHFVTANPGNTARLTSSVTAVNNTGTCFTMPYYLGDDIGHAAVFRKILGNWVMTVLEPLTQDSYWLGSAYAISGDGNTLVIGNKSNIGPNFQNGLFIYKYDELNNEWSLPTFYQMPEWNDNEMGGAAYTLYVNDNGTQVFAGSYYQSTPESKLDSGNTWDETGSCFLFDITTPSAVEILATYRPEVNNFYNDYGEQAAIDRSFTQVAILSSYSYLRMFN